MARTLERDARDLIEAYDNGWPIEPRIEAIRAALATERLAAADRARLSADRRLTPEQRAAKTARAEATLARMRRLEEEGSMTRDGCLWCHHTKAMHNGRVDPAVRANPRFAGTHWSTTACGVPGCACRTYEANRRPAKPRSNRVQNEDTIVVEQYQCSRCHEYVRGPLDIGHVCPDRRRAPALPVTGNIVAVRNPDSAFYGHLAEVMDSNDTGTVWLRFVGLSVTDEMAYPFNSSEVVTLAPGEIEQVFGK